LLLDRGANAAARWLERVDARWMQDSGQHPPSGPSSQASLPGIVHPIHPPIGMIQAENPQV
jgi:hypothetical protein